MVSRREALRLLGSALGVGLAGCAGPPDDESSPTQTASQSPLPTASRSPTSSPTDSPTATPIADVTIDDFTFDVTVAKQFTSQHPARIEAALTNQADTTITLDGGVSPPFSRYANEPRDDSEWLLIVPDLSESRYDVGALSNLDALPSTPTSDACWHVSENVYSLLRQRFTPIDAGETVTQPFDVYDSAGDNEDDICLATGDYPFKYGPELGRGRKTPNGSRATFKEIILRFTLSIYDDHSISVSVPEPGIG